MPTDAYLTLLNLDNELRLTNYGLNVTYHVDGCSFNATSLEQWVAVNQLWVTLYDNFLSRPLGTYDTIYLNTDKSALPLLNYHFII